MCFRVKGLNCFAEISSIDAILWCCERCQEKTERVRGVTRFVFMAQLVFCWSSLLAPGRGVFILLIYIKYSQKRKKGAKFNAFFLCNSPSPYGWMKNYQQLSIFEKLHFFYTFSVRLDQSENVIDTFLLASISYTKRIVRAIKKTNWNLSASKYVDL